MPERAPRAGSGRARGFLGALLLLGLSGCFAPPLLLPAPRGPFQPREWLPRTVPVELRVEPDVALRGVWVPAAGGAPVVLDFLESSGSLVTPARDSGASISVTITSSDAPLHEECGAD